MPSKKHKPEDITAMAAFLLSEEAAFVNGQVIRVDGGMGIPLTAQSIAPAGS